MTASPGTVSKPPSRLSRGEPSRARIAVALLAPALVVVLAFFVVPVARLLWQSVTVPTVGFANYAAIITDDVSLTVILRTLGMSLMVTAVCLLVAYPYAYLMTVVSRRWSVVMLAIVLIPFWTSLMARTFAWVILMQDNGPINRFLGAVGLGQVKLLGTTLGVTIAMAQVMLPFVVLPLYTTMRTIDGKLVDAALSLGARPIIAFFRIYLPLSLPGLAAGATLVMVLSLGFYVTPSLIGSPQQSMLAQLISVQVNQLFNTGLAGALALALLLVTLIMLSLVQLATRTGKTSEPNPAPLSASGAVL